MGRLDKLINFGRKAYTVGKELLNTGRQATQAIRFLESHSNKDSSIGKRLRSITANQYFQKAEAGLGLANRAVFGIEHMIAKTAPSEDLDIGHERVATDPDYSKQNVLLWE